MQFSTLKLFVLSLFVTLTSAVAFAQNATAKNDGTKDKPYLLTEITGNETLMGELLEKGTTFYVKAPFVGFGADGKTAPQNATAEDNIVLLGDTAQVKYDTTSTAKNDDVAAHVFLATTNKVAQAIRAAEQGKTYVWLCKLIMDETSGEIVFDVENFSLAPAALATLRQAASAASTVYSLDGRLVQSQYQPSALSPGLYIVGGKKVLVH